MFAANEVIEPHLARRAAYRAGERDLDHIERAIADGQAAAERLDLHISLRSGRDFHRALGQAAGSQSLTRFVVQNEEQADLYLLSLGEPRILSREHMQASNREHHAIFEAVRARDPEAAARLVIYHSQSLRTRYAPIFRFATNGSLSQPIDTSGTVAIPIDQSAIPRGVGTEWE